jgi:RimJ/RimL family protein N-acetyltransferase
VERHQPSALSEGGGPRGGGEPPRPGAPPPETTRLRAAPPGPADLEFLCALLGDPLVGATLGGVRSPDEVAEILAGHRAHWAREGFGYWIWRDRESGEPVGRGGPSRAIVEGEPVVELGWAVRSDRWGEGLATEIGAASMAFAAALGIPQVVAYTLPENAASQRVMAKLGMRYDRTFEHGRWGPHLLFRADLSPDVHAAGRDG